MQRLNVKNTNTPINWFKPDVGAFTVEKQQKSSQELF